MELKHWLQIDFRYRSLVATIEGLQSAIEDLCKFMEESDWYDITFLKEDVEPIFGLAFIGFQNYINSSIFDLEEHLSNKIEFYRYDEEIVSGITRIQLIISLANYFKHRDDSRDLHKGTSSILDELGLLYGEIEDIDSSPIFAGMELLGSPSWELGKLLEIVKDWREKIWHELPSARRVIPRLHR